MLNIIKKQPEVITGYLLGLGATLLEFIVPSFLSFYFVFVECGMHMKAGTKIRNENVGQNTNNRNIKQAVKNTDWFYGNDDK